MFFILFVKTITHTEFSFLFHFFPFSFFVYIFSSVFDFCRSLLQYIDEELKLR